MYRNTLPLDAGVARRSRIRSINSSVRKCREFVPVLILRSKAVLAEKSTSDHSSLMASLIMDPVWL
ncbi:hypothetical protein D3C86_2236480 [compost metagenome]